MAIIKPNSIWNLDCIQGMQDIRPGTVQLIVTDPPFGIGFKAKKANYNRKQSLVIDGYHEIKVDHYLKFTLDWLGQAKKILKDSGSMYIFSGYNNLKDILIALEHYSLGYQQLVWKYQFGVYTQRKFVTSHYNILHVWKDPNKYDYAALQAITECQCCGKPLDTENSYIEDDRKVCVECFAT